MNTPSEVAAKKRSRLKRRTLSTRIGAFDGAASLQSRPSALQKNPFSVPRTNFTSLSSVTARESGSGSFVTLIFFHDAPASSDWYTPLETPPNTTLAYTRRAFSGSVATEVTVRLRKPAQERVKVFALSSET